MNLRKVFESHPHWQALVELSSKLYGEGFVVYLAGGCVRDALMGKTPHDFDVATSARPEDVEKIFPRAVDVGRQFGVMIIPFADFNIEVATFRNDGEYKDGRHPESVSFSKPEEDARRRDFTVNALFYDLREDRVVDFVGGEADIHSRILRAVGEPERRFAEDKLRLVRAARFAGQLGFEIDTKTLMAMKKLAPQIQVVSKERITDEIRKLQKTQSPAKGLRILKDTGLFEAIWPQLNLPRSPKWSLYLEVVSALGGAGSLETFVAVALILEQGKVSDIDGASYSVRWDDLPFVLSRNSKQEIEYLIRGFFAIRRGPAKREDGLRDDPGLLFLNEDSGPLLTEMAYALSSVEQLDERLITDLIERFLKVADSSGRLPPPLLTGADLKSLGISPSKTMGDLLRDSYMAQITGRLKSKKEAQDWVLERLGS